MIIVIKSERVVIKVKKWDRVTFTSFYPIKFILYPSIFYKHLLMHENYNNIDSICVLDVSQNYIRFVLCE